MSGTAKLEAELLGVWRLTKTRAVSDGDVKAEPPYGRKPSGLVQFQRNGRMQCVLADGRDGINPSREYLSYTGQYSLVGGTLTTVVDGGSDPSLVGQRQIRNVSLAGRQLTLWWTRQPGNVRREFVWEKQ